MVIEAQPYGLHPKDIELVYEELRRGRVGIVPTDSVFAFCCLSDSYKAGLNLFAHLSILSKGCINEHFMQGSQPGVRLFYSMANACIQDTQQDLAGSVYIHYAIGEPGSFFPEK